MICNSIISQSTKGSGLYGVGWVGGLMENHTTTGDPLKLTVIEATPRDGH